MGRQREQHLRDRTSLSPMLSQHMHFEVAVWQQHTYLLLGLHQNLLLGVDGMMLFAFVAISESFRTDADPWIASSTVPNAFSFALIVRQQLLRGIDRAACSLQKSPSPLPIQVQSKPVCGAPDSIPHSHKSVLPCLSPKTMGICLFNGKAMHGPLSRLRRAIGDTHDAR
ncbi:uncharacterized protein BCR38DRAFT_168587 [Pseudomassariella vexata]|uniref:Uncharacterized protein n=1 Tax=Pseudomassariella vexata TaxID=1141098 RepID=A0A1Y2E2Y0_9PEZI|nr:uncharacterized protein BCR38DRAFT_168587 [Pseudomassariella vexata]ORY65903.1 hypothetical protein BCR38DRAFT_168587 [Pseudomassariella vexata]